MTALSWKPHIKVVINTTILYSLSRRKAKVEVLRISMRRALTMQAALLPLKSIICPISYPPSISPTPRATMASIAFSLVPDGSIVPHPTLSIAHEISKTRMPEKYDRLIAVHRHYGTSLSIFGIPKTLKTFLKVSLREISSWTIYSFGDRIWEPAGKSLMEDSNSLGFAWMPYSFSNSKFFRGMYEIGTSLLTKSDISFGVFRVAKMKLDATQTPAMM